MKLSFFNCLVILCIFKCSLADFGTPNPSLTDNDIVLQNRENQLDAGFNDTDSLSQPQPLPVAIDPMIISIYVPSQVTDTQPTSNYPITPTTHTTPVAVQMMTSSQPMDSSLFKLATSVELAPSLDSSFSVASLPTTLNESPQSDVNGHVTIGKRHIGRWRSNCILLNLAGMLNFSYVTKSGDLANAMYNVPCHARVSRSDCNSNEIQSIQITWGAVETPAWMRFEFRQWRHVTYLDMLRFVLPLDCEDFPDAKEGQVLRLIYNGRTFNTLSHLSYYCDLPQVLSLFDAGKLYLDGDMDYPAGTFIINYLHFQAFRKSTERSFATSHHCKHPVQEEGKNGFVFLLFLLLLSGVVYVFYRRYYLVLYGYESYR